MERDDGPSLDRFDLEVIEMATRQPPSEKLLAGLRLFDRACRLMSAGIRHERPDASDDEVRRILTERLELARALENRR
jgi:hypothetical protein